MFEEFAFLANKKIGQFCSYKALSKVSVLINKGSSMIRGSNNDNWI